MTLFYAEYQFCWKASGHQGRGGGGRLPTLCTLDFNAIKVFTDGLSYFSTKNCYERRNSAPLLAQIITELCIEPRLIGGFRVTSSQPCRWTKTKDLSSASFVRPPEVVHFSIVIGVSRGWLKTSY